MKRLLRSVVAGVSALTLSGCTLIGYLAGKSEDHKRARPQPVAREAIDTLKVGQPIEVQLWDGTKLSGRYQELRWVPEEEYARAYEAARAGGGLAAQLPALGPGADLVIKTGRVTKGELRGIAPGFLAMREKSSSPQRLVELDQVARLSDAAGHSLRGEELRTLAEERRVPSVMQLVLAQPAGNRTLELGQVASVALPAQPGGRWKKGMLIGLAVDAVVVTAVAIAVARSCGDLVFGCDDWSTPTDTTSCPLVDSFDGRAWRLDAEPLGGAFYPAAERTDVARLEHLVETEGEYRLRLRNDQQEIDHLDALALRVVDHCRGGASLESRRRSVGQPSPGARRHGCGRPAGRCGARLRASRRSSVGRARGAGRGDRTGRPPVGPGAGASRSRSRALLRRPCPRPAGARAFRARSRAGSAPNRARLGREALASGRFPPRPSVARAARPGRSARPARNRGRHAAAADRGAARSLVDRPGRRGLRDGGRLRGDPAPSVAGDARGRQGRH